MIEIWRNFYSGRAKKAVLSQVALFAIGMTGAIQTGWYLFTAVFAGIVYIFILPSVVYLIDLDGRKKPQSRRSLMNLARILFGGGSR